MVFENGFSLDIPELYESEAATEGLIADFINNVFPFGKIDPKARQDAISEFKDIIEAPLNLFGKKPETAPYAFQVSYVKVDQQKGIISIQKINFELLFARIHDTYEEKNLDAIFYRTYTPEAIKRFKRKKISRGQMKITSLISPIFFALELSILFNQLYAKYRDSAYRKIATDIYNNSWLKASDNAKWSEPDLNYAQSMLAPGYVLKPHQIEFIKAYPQWKARLNLRGIYNAFDQGLGKTLTSLSLAMALHIDKIYIVCPNTLVANWYSEVLYYYDGKVVPFDCKEKNPPANTRVFITNNESIKNILPYIDKNCRTMLIVDEGHNFRNIKSSRVQELLDLRARLNPQDVLPMSGTPLKATPNELVPAFRLLDPTFTEQAAEMYNKCFNFNNYAAMEIVTARLGKMIYRKMKSDTIKLPEKVLDELKVRIRNPEPYLMSQVKNDVNEMKKQIFPFVVEENGHIIDEFVEYVNKYSTAGIVNTKWYLNRVASAADTNNDFIIENMHELDVDRATTFLRNFVFINPEFPKDKISLIESYEGKLIHWDRVVTGRAIGQIYPPRRTAMFNAMWDENEELLISMIQSNLKKTVIFSQLYGVVTHIIDRLKANGIGVVTVNGKVKNADRVTALRSFKENEDIRVIVATSQAMGTGVTLTEASQMFFFGPPWRSADYDQCCDRIYRIGQDVDVHIYNVTLDTPQMNLSSRMDKILQWSSDMFHAAIDETVVASECWVDPPNYYDI